MCDKFGIDDKTRFLVLYLDAHWTGLEISKVIKASKRTIRRWVALTENGEDIRIEGRGRKKSITEEIENKVIQMVKEDPEGATLSKLAASTGFSARSVYRILGKKGFKYLGYDRTIVFDEAERLLRVDFCNRMLADDGKLVYRTFFSDEMGIELNSAHKSRAWQIPSEKIKRRNSTANVKLDCWGAISAQGATSLEIYKKGMNGDLYRQIIENHKTEMVQLYPDGEFYFVQDNHPSHRMNEDWMVNEAKIELIKLPRRSPDLNIIENLWFALKERVATDAPSCEKELRDSLLRNWEILTRPERLQLLFESLRRRYMNCLAKNGQKLTG